MLRYIKYHKEFIAFLKENDVYNIFHNRYAENKKLPEIERRLPGTLPMNLPTYYETKDAITWITDAFWYPDKEYEIWDELNTQWIIKLHTLKQIEHHEKTN